MAMAVFEIAVRFDNLKIVKAMIDAGTDVDSADVKPVLVTAMRYGPTELVKLLSEAGADVNPRSARIRDSPLATAAFLRNHERIKLLINAGADVNYTYNIMTLMTPAVSWYNNDTTVLMKKKSQDHGGSSCATKTCCTECIKILIENGDYANFDVSPQDYLATLNLYSRDQRMEERPLWMLLAAGVDLNLFSEFIPNMPMSIRTHLSEEEMSLMNLCRTSIRNHLLQMSPVNLFVRVPQLGLPRLLQEYLLFNVALDDDDNEDK